MAGFVRSFDLRLSVVGRGPARPQADTPASGLLIEHGTRAILLDAGQGTIARLSRTLDPLSLEGVVISHLHADHSVDLTALRYLVPWVGATGRRLPVWLPPGGCQGLVRLAAAISERPTFFAEGFDLREYAPGTEITLAGLRLSFFAGRHYVPSCGVVVESPRGARIAYTSDTGPSPAVANAVRGADLLVAEATLRSTAEDEIERGHMTGPEAIQLAREAGARSLLMTHFDTSRRADLVSHARLSSIATFVAEPDLTGVVTPRHGFEDAPLRSMRDAKLPQDADLPDVLAASQRFRLAPG